MEGHEMHSCQGAELNHPSAKDWIPTPMPDMQRLGYHGVNHFSKFT